jgi:hypothetical protein
MNQGIASVASNNGADHGCKQEDRRHVLQRGSNQVKTTLLPEWTQAQESLDDLDAFLSVVHVGVSKLEVRSNTGESVGSDCVSEYDNLDDGFPNRYTHLPNPTGGGPDDGPLTIRVSSLEDRADSGESEGSECVTEYDNLGELAAHGLVPSLQESRLDYRHSTSESIATEYDNLGEHAAHNLLPSQSGSTCWGGSQDDAVSETTSDTSSIWMAAEIEMARAVEQAMQEAGYNFAENAADYDDAGEVVDLLLNHSGPVADKPKQMKRAIATTALHGAPSDALLTIHAPFLDAPHSCSGSGIITSDASCATKSPSSTASRLATRKPTDPFPTDPSFVDPRLTDKKKTGSGIIKKPRKDPYSIFAPDPSKVDAVVVVGRKTPIASRLAQRKATDPFQGN